MPLIEPLPAALGVIIVVAAAGLMNVGSIWRLRRVRPAEVGLALVAFVGVLVFGIVQGVVVAIALSIGVFIYRAARPHDAVLGRVDDVDGYHDIERWEGAETVPGLVVYRFDAPPFFANAEYLRQRVRELADTSAGVEWLVLNAEAWTFLDATAIDVLARLHRELDERGVVLCFARLKGRQREIFAETGPHKARRARPLLSHGAGRGRRFRLGACGRARIGRAPSDRTPCFGRRLAIVSLPPNERSEEVRAR